MGHGNALKNQTIDSQIQWMVFKVKQRAKTDYSEFLGSKAVDTNNKLIKNIKILSNKEENLFADTKYSYNWPYDFFSIVELGEIKTKIDFEKPDDISSSKIFTNEKLVSTTGKALTDSNLSAIPIATATPTVQTTNSISSIISQMAESVTATNKTVSNLATTTKKGLR